MSHVKNAKMERIGGNRALKRKKRNAGGLAFCQLECQRKEMGYDMFGLEGTDCWCGSMDEFPNGALPDEEYCSDECVPVDTSLEKLAPSESAEDEEAAGAYTEIGCYSLEISPVDIVRMTSSTSKSRSARSRCSPRVRHPHTHTPSLARAHTHRRG